MDKIPIYFLLLTIIATVNTQEENNSGTFSSAFSKARKNYGPNAVFIWRGKKYTTQLKEELQHDRLFNNESAIDKSIVEDSLFILHTNNTNGALESCYCPDHPLGSLEKRVVFVKEFLVKHPNTILVDVGDFTTFSHDGFKDSLVMEAYNLMPYDAILLGDQELAVDTKKINELLLKSRAPIIGTNLVIPGLNNLIPHLIVNKAGLRVAILGIINDHILKYYPEETRKRNKLTDPIKAIRLKINQLKNKADIFILLTHQGIDLDQELASAIDSLDIIIGGHSQSVIREPKEVNGSLIVQAGKDGYYVGVVQVTYYNNTILTKSGKLEPMLLSMPSDSRVVNMIKEYENYFNKN